MKSNPSNNYVSKSQDEGSKKHNTASTSRAAFSAINASGQRQREKNIVLEAIKLHQPVTSRKLSKITGIERTNICRSLFDLVHDTPAKVQEFHIAKCEFTGKNVKHYTLAESPGQLPLFPPQTGKHKKP